MTTPSSHLCRRLGEQNPHRVPERAVRLLEQGESHQSAGFKNHLEVRLPSPLHSEHRGGRGQGVVRHASPALSSPLSLVVRNTGCFRGRLSTLSLVEFSSSQQLGLMMTLHTDLSYSHQYSSAVQLDREDTLFFQVALQTNNTFASDVLLQVDSCWATESKRPDDAVRGVLLQDRWVKTSLVVAQ